MPWYYINFTACEQQPKPWSSGVYKRLYSTAHLYRENTKPLDTRIPINQYNSVLNSCEACAFWAWQFAQIGVLM